MISIFKKMQKEDYYKETPKLKTKSKYKFHHYLIVVLGFFLFLYILFLAMDKLIIPSYVHDDEKVIIPELIGMDFGEAKTLLAKHDLIVFQNRSQYSEELPPDRVMNQTPEAGTEVKLNRRIYITVSKGGESVNVPYLKMKSLRSARVSLIRRGLKLGNIVYEHSDSIGVDTVMNQKIYSGMKVGYGTLVDLVVSKGSKNVVLVPNLIGVAFSEAIIILSEKKLQIGEITEYQNETYQTNTIIGQDPEPGVEVKNNSEVKLSISK
jgi:eukaryotic-like serine/threonine-protein kinase